MNRHWPKSLITVILVILIFLAASVTGCSDNKKYLIIVEKGSAEQISFAKSVTTNDEKSVQFIDENDREQYLTGDYITITALKNKDENLIIVKNNGILNLIFPKKIISKTATSVKYQDEQGVEREITGEITIINIRNLR